jgi:F420H(2)-dependent quinone reductase
MSTTITRTTPPQRLVTALNPVVRAALRSPAHRPLDGALLILHVVGRRTGRHYDIPVSYAAVDGRFVVVTQHRWRANLRGVSDVEVTHAGRRRRLPVVLDEDPGTVAATLLRIGDRVGWRPAGLAVTGDGAPTTAEMRAAAERYDLATISLIPA